MKYKADNLKYSFRLCIKSAMDNSERVIFYSTLSTDPKHLHSLGVLRCPESRQLLLKSRCFRNIPMERHKMFF